MDNCKVFRNRNKNWILCLYGKIEKLINSKDLTIKYNYAKDEYIRPR